MSKTRFQIQGQAHKVKQVGSFLKIHQKVYIAAEALFPSYPGSKKADFFHAKAGRQFRLKLLDFF
jgi:hypothetical protein